MAQEGGGAGKVGIIAPSQVGVGGQYAESHMGLLRERRREHETVNPRRSSLFDLLFEEVDAAEDIDLKAKQRLKQTIRRKAARQDQPEKPPEKPPGRNAGGQAGGQETKPEGGSPSQDQPDLLRVVLPAQDAAEEEALAHLAGDEDREALEHDEKVQEARHIAEQLRYCLSQHSETARKVSVYLRAVLFLNSGDMKPRMIIEV